MNAVNKYVLFFMCIWSLFGYSDAADLRLTDVSADFRQKL